MRHRELLVLDNAIDRSMYRPLEHWSRVAGFTPDHVHVPSGGALPEPGVHGHVIVSGSESSILDRAGWAEREARWAGEAARLGVRLLGSCWGHQLLAVALAGPDAVRRAAGPELGWLTVSVVDTGGLLPGGPFSCFVSHFDEVVPGCHPELRILGSSPGCEVQAARWGDLPVWGIQPHPEIDEESGRAFLEEGARRWPDHAAGFLRGLAGPVRDDHVAQGIIARFLAS